MKREVLAAAMQAKIDAMKAEPGNNDVTMCTDTAGGVRLDVNMTKMANMDSDGGPMTAVECLSTIEKFRRTIKKHDGTKISPDEMLEALDAAAGALREQIGRAYGDTLPVNFVFAQTANAGDTVYQDIRIAELDVPRWLLGGDFHLVGMEEANG